MSHLPVSLYSALKAAINADPVLAAQPNNTDGANLIAIELNKLATPAFIVWKTNATMAEVGDAFVGTDLSGMTTANHTRLQTAAILSGSGVNPSLPDRRAMFDDIFSGAGGSATRLRLLALWKRSARRGEKIFATGAGTDATPATLVFEGLLDFTDVDNARHS